MIQRLINLFIKLVKHKYVIAGVPVIIQNSKGEILLGKRRRSPIFYSNLWGLPGGMIEYQEKVEEAARREIKEELGVDVKVLRKANYYEDLPNKNCPLHLMDVPVYARIIRGIPEPKDETSQVGWFKPSEIRKMNLAYNHKKILKGERIIN